MKHSEFPFLLLLLLFSNCSSEPLPMAVITEDGSLYNSPILREQFITNQSKSGDTVLILAEKQVPRLGSGREVSHLTWYKIRKLRGEQQPYWITGRHLMLAGDPRITTILRRNSLPPSPTLIVSKSRNVSHKLPDRIKTELMNLRNIHFGEKEDRELQALITAVDYQADTVRTKAIELLGENKAAHNLAQVLHIYHFLRENWKFEPDPFQAENYNKASYTLKHDLVGDVDEFATLCSALLSASGFEVMIFSGTGPQGHHVFAEVLLGNKEVADACQKYLSGYYGIEEIPGIRPDEQGSYWLNLDWLSSNVGGQYFEYDALVQFDIYQRTYEVLTFAP